MKLITKLMLLVTMFIVPAIAQAQSAADKLFAQGQQLQKVQTVKAQNQAIAKYRSAQKAYDSSTKKAMCDDQIAICRNNIKTLSSKPKRVATTHKGKKVVKKEEEPVEEVKKEEVEEEPVHLYLSVSSMDFKSGGKKSDHHQVTINCNYDDWTYTAPDWIEVTRNGNTLTLTAKENETGEERSANFIVTCRDAKAELMVNQKAKFLNSIFKKKKKD